MPEIEEFLQYLDATGSPYHSVTALERRCLSDFHRLEEQHEEWCIQTGKPYYVTRGGSCVMGFIVGSSFNPSTGTVVVVGSHTDSPCLRVRPKSAVKKEKCEMLGVELYGGGLWHTWFDRGLGIAGKIVTNPKNTSSLKEALVRIPSPIAIVPNLAIHLQSAYERTNFKINKETQTLPVIALSIEEEDAGSVPQKSNTVLPNLPSSLLDILAKDAHCAPEEIVDVDLCLFDVSPPRLVGTKEEFLESGRLDNLVSVWASFEALNDCLANVKDKNVFVISVAFDHEEVGSTSRVGADSNLLEHWIKRVLKAVTRSSENLVYESLMARSLMLSVDMAHAVHPNYGDKHQAQHKVYMNKGLVIKENCNQRYTTSVLGMAVIRDVAARVNVPVQDFVVRNDIPCGSTIGPYLSSKLGILSVDIGVPQWAMHSARECCGVSGVLQLRQFLTEFFSNVSEIEISTI